MAEEVVVDFKINADESLRVLTEINVQMAELQKEKESLDKAMKDGTATKEMVAQYTEIETAMKVLSKARKAEEKEIYNEAQQYRYAADTIQGMSDRLRQMKDDYNKLSQADRNSADGMKAAAKIRATEASINALKDAMKPTFIDKFSAKMMEFTTRLSSGSKMFPKLIGSIKTFGTTMATTFKAIGAALAANPIGAILTAISIALAALIPIIKKVSEQFEPLKNALKGLQPILDLVKKLFEGFITIVGRALTSLVNGVTKILSIIPGFKKASEAAKNHAEVEKQAAKDWDDAAKMRERTSAKIEDLNRIVSDSEFKTIAERRQALLDQKDILKEESKITLQRMKNAIMAMKADPSHDHEKYMEMLADYKQYNQELEDQYKNIRSGLRSLSQEEAKNAADRVKKSLQQQKEAAENYQKTEKELWQMTFDLMEEGRKKANEIEEYNYQEAKKRAEKEIKDEKQRKEYLEILEAQHRKNLQNIKKTYDKKDLDDKKAKELLETKAAELELQTEQIREVLAAKNKNKKLAEIEQENALRRQKQAEEEYDNIAYLDTKRQIELYGSIEAYEQAVAEADIKVAESQQAVADAAKKVQDQISAEQQAIVNKVVGTLDAFQTVTNGFGDLFSVLAEDNEKYQKYANVLAYVDIMINMAKAMAQAIAAAKAPFPYNLIEIATGIAAVTSGIASAISIYKKNNKVESKPAFATGGLVGNQITTRTDDTVDAKLSVGEYVIRSKAVKALGVDFLDRLNGGRGDNTNRFATGGLVPSIPTVSAIDSQVNYDQMRALVAEAVENIHPVVSVKEVTNMQQKVQVKENIASY